MVGPNGKVYAFEPDQNNYQYLLQNIELHKLTQRHTGKESAFRFHWHCGILHGWLDERRAQRLSHVFGKV